MCIAIYKPADKRLSKELLETCWEANPDGAGFMYTHNGKLKIKKGFMTFDRFWASFNNLQHKIAVIHFRFKTHGEADEENTHPFFVSPTMGFVHNGIINAVSTVSNKKMSDTWHFNESILKPLFDLSPDFIDTAAVQELIQHYIGYSKLIFLDDKDNVWIVNEDKGVWDDGVWYSNSGYLARTTTSITYPVKQGEYIPKYKATKKENTYQSISKMAINTIVTIRTDFLYNGKTIKEQTQGIIETFYQDHTVGVLFFPKEQKGSQGEYVRIPFYLLDIDDADTIVNPYSYDLN